MKWDNKPDFLIILMELSNIVFIVCIENDKIQAFIRYRKLIMSTKMT